MMMLYRKFKCIEDWVNPDTRKSNSLPRTLDLMEVATYRESSNESFGDTVPRTTIWMRLNIPPIVIRMSYKEFDKVMDEFKTQCGMMDERSVKKKHKYNGPMRTFFTLQKDVSVMTFYPKHYDLSNKAPDVIQDAMLGHLITPMS